MIIVIPTGTDAPIYHWPYVTIGLILVNIALMFAVPPVDSTPQLDENDEIIEDPGSISTFERYALALGDGRLHPVQWVTHNFLHLGFLHLLFNMLFLWSFGIVIEGKLGPWKYLLTYLLIGTVHGAFLQLLLMKSGTEIHAAGASAVIFGLLAMCMIWAPRNELNCTTIMLIGFRVLVFHWDLYYTTVALLYFGQEILSLAFWGGLVGLMMIGEIGHLSGALWGTVVAVATVKLRLVDCEGWDVFALWEKRKKLAQEWRLRGDRLDREKEALRSSLKARARANKTAQSERGEPLEAQPDQSERAAAAVRKVRSLIDKGDIPAALAAYDKATRTLVNWPAQPDLYAMIKAVNAQGADAEAIRLLRDHCRYYPAESGRVRLKLAQILIRDRQRPAAALRVLEEVPAGTLPADLEAAREKLTLQARRMCDEGVLELEEDD